MSRYHDCSVHGLYFALIVVVISATAAYGQVHPLTDPNTLPGPGDDLTGTQYGRALIFLDGVYDFDAMAASGDWRVPIYKTPTEVLLTNLGQYDATGQRVAGNAGRLDGKYGVTEIVSIADYDPSLGLADVPELSRADHDFRIDFTGATTGDPRSAILHAAEAHAYYYVNDYRVRFLNDDFIDQLNLPADRANNVKNLQYRPDLNAPNPRLAKTLLTPLELFGVGGLIINPVENFVRGSTRTRSGLYADRSPVSLLFDRGAWAGDYAGVAANWITEFEEPFPGDFVAGSPSWRTSTLPVLNDALSLWVAHRITGDDEQYQETWYSTRHWAGNISTVGVTPGGIPAAKGVSSRSVMMFDEQNTSRDGVYPFRVPTGHNGNEGPVEGDLASQFLAAVFYDIAHEAGLGVHKTDLIVWKSISLLDDPDELTMRQYGAKLQEAARQLFPDPADPTRSLYEDDLADVLTSRGIPVGGVSDFRDNLPEAIGSYPDTLERSSGSERGFGTGHPMIQPGVDSYGMFSGNFNGYIHPDVTADYVAYEFYKHSKLGPEDRVGITDGTFNSSTGAYNDDGTFYLELTERDAGNLVLLSPGREVRWVWFGQRADNEANGFYAEDVRPFGFRVIQAMANGFSFTVEELVHTGDALERAFEYSGELVGTKTFRTSIVDPSLYLVEDDVLTEYFWTIIDYLGNEQTGTGLSFDFTLALDQPFTIQIERWRDGEVDTLSLRERVNDFARFGGEAFVFNAVPEPGTLALLGLGLVGLTRHPER